MVWTLDNPILNWVSCAVCDPCLVAHVSTVTVVELVVQCLGYCLDSRVKLSDRFLSWRRRQIFQLV
jgi:hypothetical protein